MSEIKLIRLDIRTLIGKSIEDKKLFALIIKVKANFTNSRIYNYSPKILSEKINTSEYITKKYVDSLLLADLCHFEGKDLLFHSLNKIMPYRSKKHAIQISKKDSLTQIVEKININILLYNLSIQDKCRFIKSNLKKSGEINAKVNIKDYKKSVKIANAFPKLKNERLVDMYVIGMRKLAEILGCSLDYAAKFIKNLVRKKLITTEKVVTKFCNFTTDFDSNELKSILNKKAGYFFNFKGSTYHYLGTKINLSSDLIDCTNILF